MGVLFFDIHYLSFDIDFFGFLLAIQGHIYPAHLEKKSNN